MSHQEAHRCGIVCRWVDPARRWHVFPATFDLFLLRGGFGDGSPDVVATVLRRAAAANSTLLLVDSFLGGSLDAGKGPAAAGTSSGDAEGDGDGGTPAARVDLRRPEYGLPRPLQVNLDPIPDLCVGPFWTLTTLLSRARDQTATYPAESANPTQEFGDAGTGEQLYLYRTSDLEGLASGRLVGS